jgi:hypothetical protein
MTTEDEMIAIRQAVEQTVRIGSTYLAAPLPWWEIFLNCGSIVGFGNVRWSDICQEIQEGDDSGDVVVCLLPSGHQTDHGGPHMQVSSEA